MNKKDQVKFRTYTGMWNQIQANGLDLKDIPNMNYKDFNDAIHSTAKTDGLWKRAKALANNPEYQMKVNEYIDTYPATDIIPPITPEAPEKPKEIEETPEEEDITPEETTQETEYDEEDTDLTEYPDKDEEEEYPDKDEEEELTDEEMEAEEDDLPYDFDEDEDSFDEGKCKAYRLWINSNVRGLSRHDSNRDLARKIQERSPQFRQIPNHDKKLMLNALRRLNL